MTTAEFFRLKALRAKALMKKATSPLGRAAAKRVYEKAMADFFAAASRLPGVTERIPDSGVRRKRT